MSPGPTPKSNKNHAQGLTAGEGVPVTTSDEATPSTGKRQALRDLRRELTDSDLASSGVQKMLLHAVDAADAECEVLTGYRTRFHEADKRAAVLEEKLRTQTAIEVAFGVGLGLGCAIIGLTPLFWTEQPLGYITLGIGLLLALGASIVRVIKR